VRARRKEASYVFYRKKGSCLNMKAGGIRRQKDMCEGKK
jgi:hypothetical protein